MNQIKERVNAAAGKRILGILEGKAGYTVKANFAISTEELMGEDGMFQSLEVLSGEYYADF